MPQDRPEPFTGKTPLRTEETTPKSRNPVVKRDYPPRMDLRPDQGPPAPDSFRFDRTYDPPHRNKLLTTGFLQEGGDHGRYKTKLTADRRKSLRLRQKKPACDHPLH